MKLELVLSVVLTFLSTLSLVHAEDEVKHGLTPAHSDGSVDYLPASNDKLERREKVKACWEDSEPRGKGHLPDRETRECPENQEKSMGICYPKCGPKRIGVGPICVDDCKDTIYKSSSAMFCCDSDEVCSDLMSDAAMKMPKALVQFLIDIATHPNDVRKIAQDFRTFMANAMELRLPLCSKLAPPEGESPDVGEVAFSSLEEEQSNHEEEEIIIAPVEEVSAEETLVEEKHLRAPTADAVEEVFTEAM